MVDKIYCINLHERDDRLQNAKIIFDKYDLPVTYHRVWRDNESGQRGCFNSHIEVIKKAASQNLNNVMIFEDDIKCALSKGEFDECMEKVYNFITHNDFDIFFLGSCPNIWLHSTKKINDNIYKVKAYQAHAYILSRSGINKYQNLVYSNIQIDHIYAKSNKSFAIYPSIFYQNDSPSSIDHPWIGGAYVREKITKFQEYYAANINIPIIDILKLVIIIAAIGYLIYKLKLFLVIIVICLITIIITYQHENS